jgi:hypothetical protein
MKRLNNICQHFIMLKFSTSPKETAADHSNDFHAENQRKQSMVGLIPAHCQFSWAGMMNLIPSPFVLAQLHQMAAIQFMAGSL